MGRNLLHRSTTGHLDIPRLQQANVSLQAFTVVTTIPRKLKAIRTSEDVCAKVESVVRTSCASAIREHADTYAALHRAVCRRDRIELGASIFFPSS